MSDEKRSPAIPLKILEGGYTLVPAFWTEMMGVVAEFDKQTGERIPTPAIDKHIPASFWKYSLVLWRDVVGPNCVARGFVAKKTMNDFGIRPATAMRWTAAYMASGLFDIALGARHVKGVKGSPSVFKYLNGSEDDWRIFIKCLAWLCSRDKHEHNAQEGSEGSVAAFRAELTWAVGATRKSLGLSPVLSPANRAFLNQCEKNGIVRLLDGTDMLNRLQVTREPTNRMGVLDKRDQAIYYDLRDDELALSIPTP